MTAPATLPRPEQRQTQRPRQERPLYCFGCEKDTRHVLSLDKTMYVCPCGSVLIYYRNLNPRILE